MLKSLRQYVWNCLVRAMRGSLSSALNWASILGVGAVGAYYQSRGMKISDPRAWQDFVAWGLVYTAVAWSIIFAVRAILVAPFQTYVDSKVHIHGLEERLKPRLKLSFETDKKANKSEGHRYTFLRVANESERHIDGVLIKIIESKFKRHGSELWENTSIIANMNMSWFD
jgi:hypothetical protein